MRSILFDELLDQEVDEVRAYLTRNAKPSGVEDLFWIALDRDIWTEAQKQAWADEEVLEGFRFAVELGPDWIRFELLIRSETLRNLGGGQADEAQTLFVLRWANEMARRLNLVSCVAADLSLTSAMEVKS